jgi:hypothetical protein
VARRHGAGTGHVAQSPTVAGMGSLLGSWCNRTGAWVRGAWWRRPAVVRALNARTRVWEQACACGAPSNEAEPARGRRGPSSEAEPARGKRTPFERGGAHSREACALERGGACSRGSLSGPPWWAAGATAAWAMPRVRVWARRVWPWLFAGFKWDFPIRLRGPPGLSPTISNDRLLRVLQEFAKFYLANLVFYQFLKICVK